MPQALDCPILSVDYDLAPEHPFPVAAQQVRTGRASLPRPVQSGRSSLLSVPPPHTHTHTHTCVCVCVPSTSPRKSLELTETKRRAPQAYFAYCWALEHAAALGSTAESVLCAPRPQSVNFSLHID
jgi:hypothetical protein